jgi:hypothetical protein
MPLWLESVPSHLREQAREAFEAGELRFLWYAPKADSLYLVLRNIDVLQKRGIYERALLEAYDTTDVNNRNVSLGDLKFLFSIANRKRLLEAGDPLPGPGPFLLFRGVAGLGRARRIRGLSWTASYERAIWFATRFPHLSDPAVYQIRVEADDIFAYLNRLSEQEFIVNLPKATKPIRVALKSDGSSSLQNHH